VAENPDLAYLAAQEARPIRIVEPGDAFLRDLPLAVLTPPQALMNLLTTWGLRTVGDLTALARGDLLDRLGPAGAELWDRASGRTQRLLRHLSTPPTFYETIVVEHCLETLERRLLDSLAHRLRGLYKVAGGMRLTIPLDDGTAHEYQCLVPAPTTDGEVLFRILHTYLDGLRLAQHPVGVRLELLPTVAECTQHLLFGATLRDPNRFGETLGRISALVGEGHLGTPQAEDTHRPDAYRLASPRFSEVASGGVEAGPLALGLPLRRFRPPRPWGPAAASTVPRHGPYHAHALWWEASPLRVQEWDVASGDAQLLRCQTTTEGEMVMLGIYDG
jgi:protein ImuB